MAKAFNMVMTMRKAFSNVGEISASNENIMYEKINTITAVVSNIPSPLMLDTLVF